MKATAFRLISALSLIPCFLRAQPGYMGNKQLVEVYANVGPSYALRGIKPFLYQYGVNYEKASSESASWNYSLRMGRGILNQDALDKFSANVNFRYNPYPNNPSSYGTVMVSDTMKYRFKEIAIQRRWYSAGRGAVAPYGMYIGLEASYSWLKQTTGGLKYYYYYDHKYYTFEDVKSRTHHSLCMALVIGGRRMITPNIGISVNASSGYALFQTSKPSLASSYSEDLVNHMDYQEALMVRHYVMSKLLQVSASISYLF